MYQTKEVDYVFNYNNGPSQSFQLKRHFAVEPTQKTRIEYLPAHLEFEGYPEEQWVEDKGIGYYLNYAGTGAENSTIEAQLVDEQIIEDREEENGSIHYTAFVSYLLPDVGTYANGTYNYEYVNDPAAGGWTKYESLNLDFLPKL